MSKKAQPMTALVAFSYANRRLKPGDNFIVRRPVDAKILAAIGKASMKRVIGSIPPPPAPLARKLAKFDHDGDGNPGGSKSPPQSDERDALRAEYLKKFGKRPFNGWDVPTLRQKIAAG